jgi:hypothetical protein
MLNFFLPNLINFFSPKGLARLAEGFNPGSLHWESYAGSHSYGLCCFFGLALPTAHFLDA